MKKINAYSQRSQLLSLNTTKEVYDFLSGPTVTLAEVLTGILASDMSSYKLSAGKLVQATVKGRLFTQLGREIKQYQEQGRIKEDYFATNKSQASLLELLQFIDSDIPDEEVFKAMKSVFFTIASVDSTEKEEHVGYQLLQICKKLNSMDMLILKTCYKIFSGEDLEGVNTGINAHGDWVTTVSNKIGLDLPELVYIEDDKLVQLGLLTGRGYSDKSGISASKEFRLTRLGLKLCEYVRSWEG